MVQLYRENFKFLESIMPKFRVGLNQRGNIQEHKNNKTKEVNIMPSYKTSLNIATKICEKVTGLVISGLLKKGNEKIGIIEFLTVRKLEEVYMEIIKLEIERPSLCGVSAKRVSTLPLIKGETLRFNLDGIPISIEKVLNKKLILIF